MRQNEHPVSPMSSEGRNHYVVEHLTASLLELLKTRALNDISISELCHHAGVGRASFYRNFQSKEDIIKNRLNELFSACSSAFMGDDDSPLHEKIKILFSHFEKNREFCETLYTSGLTYLLKDVLVGIYGPTAECTAAEAYSKAFVAYSLYGWVEIWLQRGMKESPEELSALFRMV